MRLVLALIAVLIAVILAVQNASTVILTLFLWQVEAPLAVIIVVSFATGMAVSLPVFMPRLRRMRAQERQLRTRLADAEAATEGTAAAAQRPHGDQSLRVNEHAPG